MNKSLVSLALRITSILGLEVHYKGIRSFRGSMAETLTHLGSLGFAPATIFDIGAASGTTDLYEAFPNSEHILIEPLEERRRDLEKISKRYRVRIEIAAATEEPGYVSMNVHPDLDSSSILEDVHGDHYDGLKRVVRATTIDQLQATYDLKGPFLIKLDIQGAELRALEGSRKTIHETEVVITEVSLFEFYSGTPTFRNVIDYLDDRDFVVYDLCGGRTRPLDGALAQFDVVFVKRNGLFRKSKLFADAKWLSSARKL